MVVSDILYNARAGINYAIVNKSDDSGHDVSMSINDVCFLKCDVEDSETQNMAECWASSIEFIDNARAAGGKVLVQLWGRSRSASIILAWLMLRNEWPMWRAEEYLQSKCAMIDSTLIYKNQLPEFVSSRRKQQIKSQ